MMKICPEIPTVSGHNPYLDGYYIFSLDGTGQYSSEKVHCECCCEKHHRNGRVEYYHHMLGAVLVHPEKREIIPLAPEPIVKGDGESRMKPSIHSKIKGTIFNTITAMAIKIYALS